MDEGTSRILRSGYHALRCLRDQFNDELQRNHTLLESSIFAGVQEEVERIESACPGLLPKLDPTGDAVWRGEGAIRYRANVLVSYLNRAIARLEVEIDSPTASPVTQAKTFPFVRDVRIRDIIERDYSELQRAFIAECWKSVILLAGSSIEALLVDLLEQNQPSAVAAKAAPRPTDITRWDLSDLIKVAIELKLISTGVEKLSHSIREYRNLIHPGNEVRNALGFGREEARIAIEVLHMLHRELSP